MPYIEFRNISKSFGDCISCNDISLTIDKGTVHSIIGENGAGKSTLMKLLGGIETASSGQIYIEDKPYSPRSAQDAFQNKIAFIHQHFVLADQLTALDNLVLSASSQSFSLRFKDTKKVESQAKELMQKFGWHLQLKEQVKNLSVGEQQRLEILKALMPNPDIIIFDEPTAVLTPQESHELLQFILQLKDSGKTIILISHKLHEIESVSDEISILRHGKYLHTSKRGELSIEQLAEKMIGRRVVKNNSVQRPDKRANLCALPDSDITLKQSEVFGVAGIEGNGQNLLIEKLLKQFRELKLSYGDITEDRIKLSVFENLNLFEHMLLKHKGRFTRNGIIDQASLKKNTSELVHQWDVRPPDINKALYEFSGGNQQKFAVGRELWAEPTVLLAAHPTRGVDLGAQDKIHTALLAYTENKKTVVLVSSDLDEVLFLSDRFVIMNKNKIYGPFLKDELSEQQIGLYMAGNL